MATISETEFARMCDGIRNDRDVIIKHNPVGTAEETLLWMLLGCLISYLGLTDLETPCFTGRPDAATYRDAVEFVLKDRRTDNFDPGKYLDRLTSP
jgi:hypothetical protein